METRECKLKENKVEQLLFWDPTLSSDIDMGEEVRTLKERQEKLRKGLFQRYSDLCKEVQELRMELVLIKMKTDGQGSKK